MKRFHQECILTAVICAIIIILVSSSAAAGVIYVKWNSTGPTNDGQTWDTAFHKVQDGINAAVTGDEVWVAEGTYTEAITLKDGVGLYGGFAGQETTRDQRDWGAHPCLLQCNTSVIVSVPKGAGPATMISGFVITWAPTPRGSFLSNIAINCDIGSSPVIANNTIRNVCSGIMASSASPQITGNVILRCDQGAISCGGSSRIVGNTIAFVCQYGGVSLPDKMVGAVSFESGSPLFANNIVAHTSLAIRSGSAAVLRNNCLYGNRYDYQGPQSNPVGRDGNISADPRFADADYLNMHIQPDSPCVDAGDISSITDFVQDMDAQVRVHGSGVDIGADETRGSAWPVGPSAVIRVAPTGSDSNDGSSWDDAHAVRTIRKALSMAFTRTGEVWVAAGEYPAEVLNLYDGVSVYGGFAGSETKREERDFTANPTTCLGSRVMCYLARSPQTRLDGLILRGLRPITEAPAVMITSSAAVIANCIITGYRKAFTATGAIEITESSIGAWNSPTITDNTIDGNSGYGIFCRSWMRSDTVVIRNNHITNNGWGGIMCSASSLLIQNNSINNNGGFGINQSYGWVAIITGNQIRGNSQSGVYIKDTFIVKITDNTVVSNGRLDGKSDYYSRFGIACYPPNYPAPKPDDFIIRNNIVAYQHVGVSSQGRIQNNNVFGSTSRNYWGTDLTGTDGNISTDPMFVNPLAGDYRLMWNSPCVDAGLNDGVPSTDLLGNPRPVDGNMDGSAITDMGAFEYQPVSVTMDVVPGNSLNRVPIQKNGMVVVAIIGTPTIDVRSVNPRSIVFGPGRAVEAHGKGHLEDANGDGRLDMVLHFRCPDIGLPVGTSTVYLQGRLASGEPFSASDKVTAITMKDK